MEAARYGCPCVHRARGDQWHRNSLRKGQASSSRRRKKTLPISVISVRGRKTCPIAIARRTTNAGTDSAIAGIARRCTPAAKTSDSAAIPPRNATATCVSTDVAGRARPTTNVAKKKKVHTGGACFRALADRVVYPAAAVPFGEAHRHHPNNSKQSATRSVAIRNPRIAVDHEARPTTPCAEETLP